MTDIKTPTQQTKAWIASNRYHGLEKDTATKTGLSKETVRAHFKMETPETKATETVLNAAMNLIQARQNKLSRKIAKVTGGPKN